VRVGIGQFMCDDDATMDDLVPGQAGLAALVGVHVVG
jgi:hypothetical protein